MGFAIHTAKLPQGMTPVFAAPEWKSKTAARLVESLSPDEEMLLKGDIFSLGVSLIFLYCATVPVDGAACLD